MTVTLELKPETEARAAERAAAQGVPVEEFLTRVIEDSLGDGGRRPFHETASAEEWESALDEFAGSAAFVQAPPFVDDGRESVYREREDSQR